MLKVGITGGIGSGKTTVCKIFELLGIPVFYADQAAKELMQYDDALQLKLVEKFGPDIYLPNRTINRTYLANIVFNDEKQLAALNAIVHPAVFSAFDKWLSKQSAKYVVKEAALLFESGSHQLCDVNVLVQAPEEIRIKRVMKRDQITKEQVLGRIAQQMSDEEKSKLADYVLMNDETKPLIPQILNLHQKLLAGDLPK